jgi:hypothetical protein
MAKVCVFCSRPGISAEHVLPRWLKAAFDSGDLTRGPVVRMSEAGVHRHEQRLLDGRVKAVCAQCNNGWMSRLEEEVRDFLPEMIRGRVVWLDHGRLEALAAWSLKTVFMFREANRHPTREIIPVEDYTAFYRDRQPSRLMSARLACIAPPVNGPVVFAVDFSCPTFGLPDGGFGYIATLRIGYFVVQICRAGPLAEENRVRRFAPTGHTVPLWPQAPASYWPPLLPIPGQRWHGFTDPQELTLATEPVADA